jgi:hypothetical protein
LKIGQVMADRDGIDANRNGQLIDGRARLAQESLQDTITRAFHLNLLLVKQEYISPLFVCQYTRIIS